MTVKFDWDPIEKDIGLYELGESWTWQELRETMVESWEQISKANRIVDSMMLSKNRNVPPNAMPHVYWLNQNRPANAGTLMLVNATAIQRSIIRTVSLVYSGGMGEMPIAFASSIEEARQKLVQKMLKRGDVIKQL